MSFMANNKRLVLVYPEMDRLFLSEDVNIMLAPQYYTLKKEELPIKYAYQAKRVAPSLFEGLLEDDKKYEYFVFKENEKWAFIAYCMKDIEEALASKGISPRQVGKLFFAQQSLAHFDTPLFLGDNEALVAISDNVAVVPRSALGIDVPSADFNDQFAPTTGVSPQGEGGTLIGMKYAVILGVIFTAFAGVFFAEGMQYSKGSDTLNKELSSLYEQNPALQDEYKRESIVSKYKNIDSKEREKRDLTKKLSKLIFKGSKLTSLTLTDTSVKATFECQDKQKAIKVVGMAQKDQFKSAKVVDENTVQIEEKI